MLYNICNVMSLPHIYLIKLAKVIMDDLRKSMRRNGGYTCSTGTIK